MKTGRQLATLCLLAFACKNETPQMVTLDKVPGHEQVPQDNSQKESPRLVPAEAYMRTYLVIFGGTTALQAQRELAVNSLFDNWTAYLGALGLPNYVLDLPRKGETNALMIATFERLGVALCDRAMEKDLAQSDVKKRLIYAFDIPKDPVDEAGFASRFDVLHRTFLSYPAKVAPTDRTARFFKLYQETVAEHDVKATPRFTPTQAGFAALCYGLVRHPEFHLY